MGMGLCCFLLPSLGTHRLRRSEFRRDIDKIDRTASDPEDQNGVARFLCFLN